MENKSVSVGHDNVGIINQGDHNSIHQSTHHYHHTSQNPDIDPIFYDAIVSIYNEKDEIVGTGVLITSNYILTSSDTIKQSNSDDIKVLFPLQETQSLFQAKIVEQKNNITLLEIKNNKPFKLPLTPEDTQPSSQGFVTYDTQLQRGYYRGSKLEFETSPHHPSGLPIWDIATNSLKGISVMQNGKAKIIPIHQIIEDFKPLQKARRDWVWRSSFKSVAQGKISLFAMVETFIAMSIALAIWYYNGTFIHILAGLAIAPFLLLRTPKSTEDGVKLFKKIIYTKIIDYLSDFLNIVFWLSIGYLYFNLEGIYIGIVIAIIGKVVEKLDRQIVYKYKYKILKELVEFLNIIINALSQLFVIPFITILVAILIKIYVTLKYLSIKSINSIPKNWKLLVLSLDSFHPPEIMPEIETRAKNDDLDMLKFSNFRVIIREGFPWTLPYLIIYIFLTFIPSFFYRYSIKATAIFYLPFLWLIAPPKTTLTERMEIESQSFWAYLMFGYSLIIVFIFTLLPIYLNIHQESIIAKLPTFISPDIYSIFFAVEFNLWHLTRLISALITILFIWQFPRIIKMRKTNPTYGNYWGAKLLDLDKVRTICTLFTLSVTLYLMYQAVPDGYIQAMWQNMKLLPM
jgi:hypothetical protein